MIKRLIRLYLIGRAPEAPQPWFEPAMPGPAPIAPAYLTTKELKAEERHEYEGWREDYLGTRDLMQPRIRAYAEAADAHRAAHRAWCAEHAKQRLIQWPRAWADAVISATHPIPIKKA